MENPQLLATESFSYNRSPDHENPSSNSPEHISIDSSNEALEEHQTFNFDVPVSRSSDDFIHADEIFCNGYIMPVYLDRISIPSSTSAPESPITSLPSNDDSREISSGKKSATFMKKWRRSSNRIVRKCSGFFRPILKSLGCSGKDAKVDDLGRKFWEIQIWRKSTPKPLIQEASPRQSVAYSAVDWAEMEQAKDRADVQLSLRRVKSLDISPQDSPIQSSSLADQCQISDAILHCKQSTEVERILE